MTGTNFNCVFVDYFYLTEYCRSVTIVTKTKTTFFTRKIDQFHLKTGQFRHFFEVKNVVDFSNSSRQYSVNTRLKSYLECPNILKLVEFALAIPVSNAYVERIFSLMKNLWTDERNRLSTDMIKAELCVKLNYSHSCKEFYTCIIDQKTLIKAARSNSKY